MALKPCKSCKHQIDSTAKSYSNYGVANFGADAFVAIRSAKTLKNVF